tara:strand:- start:9873 stop:10631 length:759 start_codon:yes stop_codon:yes gene_type:complete
MKCKINGNNLRDKIDSVLLKGKWNNGANSKSSILCPSIVISVGETYVRVFNANASTFVSNDLETIEIDNHKAGKFAIDSEILLKYLPKEDCIFQLEDNIFQLISERKTVNLPILERHENNDSILFVNKHLDVSRDINKNVIISEKTQLKTRIKVSSEELSNALLDCEAVGNSVFQLDYDGINLNVSSSNGREMVLVKLEPVESVGEKATMEFSAPIHKYLNGLTTIISFNDESPLSIISGKLKVLRAPRIEV